MGKFNLHTHTGRCHHAVGEDREYIEAAIRAGYTEIGFSDHAPMIFPASSGYISHFRMLPSDYEDYVKSILALKEEYASDIRIYLGLETEYYPELFEKNLAFYCQYPIDYLIQGQHFIGNEYDLGSHYAGMPTDNESFLRRHVRQTIEGMETGSFTYVAHPDLAYFTGDKETYRFEVGKLCAHAKDLGIPLELNLLGFKEGRNYPNPLFWEVARRIGNDVVIGLDAHSPAVYEDTVTRAKLEKWAKKMKLKVLTEMPTLKDPKTVLK